MKYFRNMKLIYYSIHISDATSDTNDFIVELDTVMDKPSVVEDDVAEEKEEMLSPETEDTGKTSLPVKKQKEFSADRLDVCPPGLATRVHRMMLQSLIPQLHKKLTEKVRQHSWQLYVNQCVLPCPHT